jgi:hypothetical protein
MQLTLELKISVYRSLSESSEEAEHLFYTFWILPIYPGEQNSLPAYSFNKSGAWFLPSKLNDFR